MIGKSWLACQVPVNDHQPVRMESTALSREPQRPRMGKTFVSAVSPPFSRIGLDRRHSAEALRDQRIQAVSDKAVAAGALIAGALLVTCSEPVTWAFPQLLRCPK